MKFLKEADKLYSKLEQEEVEGKPRYFKKREVFPPLNRDGSINWKHFLIGNWKSFILVVVIVLISIGVIIEYITNVKIGAECIARENILKNLLEVKP